MNKAVFAVRLAFCCVGFLLSGAAVFKNGMGFDSKKIFASLKGRVGLN